MAIQDLTNQNIQDTYQKVVQTDGVNLADGTGSLLPIEFDGNNVIISGTLTAQTYVVSESITSVSSGSTIFGNSSDDLHQMTGSLKVSTTITSPIIISTTLAGTLATATQTNITSVGTLTSLNVSGDISGDNITSSGDILVADNIIHKDDPDTKIGFIGNTMAFQAGGTTFASYTSTSNQLTFIGNTSLTGNITASSHISSSGNIVGDNLIGTIDGGSF